MEEKIFFHSKDSTKLCGVWTLPERPTTKAIILAHGITVEKNEDGIFTNLANMLASYGFVVFRFDFRAHGESEGDSLKLTLTKELEDLESAFQYVSKKEYTRIGLLGASFGGSIAILYAASHEKEISSLFLWNPVLNYEHCFLNPTLPWLVKRKGHLKTDIAEKGWTTLGSKNYKIGKPLFDEMGQMFPYKEITKLRLPMCIIHGDKDTKVPYEDSKEVALSIPQIQFFTIKNAEHGFHDSREHAEEANSHALEFFQKTL